MLVAFEGIDGSGKSTLIDRLLRQLTFYHCIEGKKKLERYVNNGTTPAMYGFSYRCCENNCVFIKKSDPNTKYLYAFKDSIYKLLGCGKNDDWRGVASDFVKYCFEKSSEMYESLFLLSFLELSELERKTPHSIILVDRYILSNLVYKAKKDGRIPYSVGGVFERTNEDIYENYKVGVGIKKEIENRIANFDWNLFPFSKEEVDNFLKENNLNIVLPHKTIYLDNSVDDCVRDIFYRKRPLTKHEHIDELEFRARVYKDLLRHVDCGSVITTDENKNEEFVGLLAHGLIKIWCDFTNKIAVHSGKVLYERRKNAELINELVDSLYCNFDRYHIAYEGKEYQATSPTKLLKTLTDYKPVDNHYLEEAEKEAFQSIKALFKNSQEKKIPLDECLDAIKSKIFDIHERPGQMLRRAGNIGTQTHAVIEEIIKYIIRNDDGFVESFEERDVLAVANSLYQKVISDFKGKWLNSVQWEMVVQFLEYQRNHVKQWVGSEILVFSKTAVIGGRFDAIAVDKEGFFVIVDFKTSKTIRKSHYAQLIMYYMLIEDYFYELLIKFNNNKGILRGEDIAENLEENSSHLKNDYLKSLNRFFHISREHNDCSWKVDYGHLVHLRKDGAPFKVKKMDFSELRTLRDTPVFNKDFLERLTSGIKLINCLTDWGYGYNKKGEKVKYVN